MKKIVVCLVMGILFFTGCTKVEEKGDYKEGTYYGYVESESYGKTYVTSAVVYINEEGSIKSVFIDSTYIKDEVVTTKKSLGDKYSMKATSAKSGKIEGGAEWYEQAKTLETKIVEEQGTNWVKYQSDNATLDSVSGVTIKANTLVEAVNKALEQAK